jgi:DNA invertase Pin-like site-specific DNA recombinase
MKRLPKLENILPNALGVEVNFVDEWVENADTAEGAFMQSVKFSIATLERKKIKEGSKKKVSLGKPPVL